MLDVSVSDAKGQPVADLRPDEFERSDNGVQQKILSITFVDGGLARNTTVTAPAPGAPTAVGSGAKYEAVGSEGAIVTASEISMPSITAILFGPLTPTLFTASPGRLIGLSPKLGYATYWIRELTHTFCMTI